MLEGQASFYLQKYLGKYLNGLDAESLRISVWKGDVELRNLTLKPEALQDLDLPCTVKAGLLGRLTLKVPWARLGQEPVVAEFDRLYILAEPNSEESSQQDVAEYLTKLDTVELEHKRRKVAEAESKWLKDLEEKASQQQALQQGGGAAQQNRGGWGLGVSIHHLIDSILGNLQLVLTNVHIRYEDDGWAWAGHRLAVGVLLGRVAAHTVDDQGKPAFVTTDVLLLLRKAVTLTQLGAYFDVDRPGMQLPPGVASWQHLSPSDWDKLFSPALHLKQQQQQHQQQPQGQAIYGGTLYTHDYLIHPVSGGCNYTRRSSKFRRLPSSSGTAGNNDVALAKHETAVRLQGLAVALSGSQYVGAQALAEALDAVAARAPHAHVRPKFRPNSGTSARAWWQYALRAVRVRYLARTRGSSWSTLSMVCSLRKRYVPHYAKCLAEAVSAPGGSRAEAVGGDSAIAAMDAQLEEATILVFRRMAHTRVRSMAPAAPNPNSPGGGKPAAPPPQQQTWASWLGWRSAPATTAAAAKEEAGGELGPEEWRRLEELLASQEGMATAEDAAASREQDSPLTPQTRVTLNLSSLSLTLVNSHSTSSEQKQQQQKQQQQQQALSTTSIPHGVTAQNVVVLASMEAIALEFTSFPASTRVRVRVGAAGVASPFGQLFQAGQLTQRASDTQSEPPPEPPSAQSSGWQQHAGLSPFSAPGSRRVAGSEPWIWGSEDALGAEFMKRPPDGRADACLHLLIAPSYVTYVPLAVSAVQQFFSTRRKLELATLQAQAEARAEAVRQLASLQLRALGQAALQQDKPKLALAMCAHAPKVAVPDATGRSTLVVDLGRFSLATAPTSINTPFQAAQEPQHEGLGSQLMSLSVWPESQRSLLAVASGGPGLSAEEAAVYEGYAARLDSVAAYLITSATPHAHPPSDSTPQSSQQEQPPPTFAWPEFIGHARALSEARGGQNGDSSGKGGVSSWDLEGVLSAPGSRWQTVPLLERFGVDVGMLLATTVHPKYSQVRLDVRASAVHFHLSPFRLQCLIGVMELVKRAAAQEQQQEQAQQAAAVDMQVPQWRRDAEVHAKVGILTFESEDGQNTGRWITRDVYVWRGKLVIAAGPEESHPLVMKSFWQADSVRVVEVPPQLLGGGGPANTIALLPAAALSQQQPATQHSGGGGWWQRPNASALLELPDSVVIRCNDTGGVRDLRRALMRSRATMEAVAGLMGAGVMGEGGASEATGGTSEEAKSAEESPLLTGPLNFAELVQLRATLPELGLHVTGRPPHAALHLAALHDSKRSAATPAGSAHSTPTPISFSGAERRDALYSQAAGGRGAAAAKLLHLFRRSQKGGQQGDCCEEACLEDEVPLILARLRMAVLDVAYNSERLKVVAAMRALEMDDLLLGAIDPSMQALARSGEKSIVQSTTMLPRTASRRRQQQQQQQQTPPEPSHSRDSSSSSSDADAFFDACSDFSRASSLLSEAMNQASSASDSLTGVEESEGLVPATYDESAGPLVSLAFTQWSGEPSKSSNVGSELVARMSCLTFSAHRPTLAALMSLGTDLSAAAASGADAPVSDTATPSSGTQADDDEGELEGAEEQVVLAPPPAPPRSPMRLVFEMQQLELVLPYECGGTSDSHPPLLAQACVENFCLNLDSGPDSMEVRAQLGNIVTSYEVLPASAAHCTLCTMRKDAESPKAEQQEPASDGASLVDITFRTHSPSEAASNPRVPAGITTCYSLEAQLRALQLVFLMRSLNELLEYVSVMMAMQLPPCTPPSTQPSSSLPAPAAGSQFERRSQQQQHRAASAAAQPTQQPMALLLDVSMAAPIICLPESSSSASGIQLDLGSLAVSNTLLWKPAAQDSEDRSDSEGWVLVDDMQVLLSRIALVVIDHDGVHGPNMMRDLGSGLQLKVSRPLGVALQRGGQIVATPASSAAQLEQAPALPPMQVALDVPDLVMALSDSEYEGLLGALSFNFAELPAGPCQHPHMRALRHAIMQHQQKVVQQPADERHALHKVKSSRAASGGTGTSPKPAHISGPESDFSLDVKALLSALADKCSMVVSVRVRSASLHLLTHLHKTAGSNVPAQPLAVASLSELCVWVTMTARGSKVIRLVLPSIALTDSRPGVSANRALVLTTNHVVDGEQGSALSSSSNSLPPSLLAMEFRSIMPHQGSPASPESSQRGTQSGGGQDTLHASLPAEDAAVVPLPRQALQLRLQKPTLVLDLAFLMPLAAFFSSSSEPSSDEAHGVTLRSAMRREVLLGREVHLAQEDLWLSPEVRLLADAPGVTHFVYDGQGSSLILPPGLPPSEVLPLILVAPNCKLQLRNVRVVNANSLAAVLSMGPGASLRAQPEDGVVMIADEVEAGVSAGRDGSNRHSSSGRVAASAQSTPSAPDGKSFEMVVHAVGAEVHLVDAADTPLSVSKGNSAGGGVQGGLPQSASAASLQEDSDEGGRGFRRVESGQSVGSSSVRHTDSRADRRVQMHMLRRLVLLLDVTAKQRTSSEGGEQQQQCDVAVSGLSVKAVTTVSSAVIRQPDSPHSHQQSPNGASTWSCSVLEPCDMAIKFHDITKPGGEGQMDVKLDVSDLSLKLSPDVLQLILSLQRQVTQPLAVPPIDQPLFRCDLFERMWSNNSASSSQSSHSSSSSSGGAGMKGSDAGAVPVSSGSASQHAAAGGAGRGGVDPMAHFRGMTIWRPRPPSGYVALGDVVTAGSEAPRTPVAVLALGSGLVTWPSGFTCVWDALEGIALWMPVPPPGFVALGCCASVDHGVPPPLQGVCACVAANVCVEARLRECLLLSTAGHVWSVANAASSLTVLPAEASHDCPESSSRDAAVRNVAASHASLWDLRSPLGVPPAARAKERELREQALAAQQAEEEERGEGGLSVEEQEAPLSKLLQESFLAHRASLLSAVARIRSVATAVEFRRIWWDKHNTPSPSPQRVSFWRPVPPSGYVALADCMGVGMHAPPPGVMVLADEEPLSVTPPLPVSSGTEKAGTRAGGFSKATKPPLLARPIGYKMVWMDEQKMRAGETQYLSLWKPVAPAGYVALGCMAGIGAVPPPTAIIRCIRADVATRVDLPASAPTWTQPMHRQRMPVLGWTADERLSSFVVVPAPVPSTQQQATPSLRLPEAWALNLSCLHDEEEAQRREGASFNSGSSGSLSSTATGTETGGHKLVSIEVQIGRCAALLRTCARIPLLEVGAADIRVGLGTHAPGVTRGFAFLTVSAWSYAPLAAVWEPVMEPWQVLGHVDLNSTSRQRVGVAPGMWVRLSSTQGTACITLAHNAANALLQSAGQWSAALTLHSEPGSSASSTAPTQQQLKAAGNNAEGLLVPHGERGKAWTSVQNTLGREADMLMDYGDHQEVVSLPPGQSIRVVLPLPSPPPGPLTGHGISAVPAPVGHKSLVAGAAQGAGAGGGIRWTPPTIRLLVDVQAGQLPLSVLRSAEKAADCEDEGHKQPGSLEDLVCNIKLSGQAAEFMPLSSWGLSTRAASPSLKEAQSANASVSWQERFVLSLPAALSEQLVQPAPGDNPFAGQPLSLAFQLASPQGGGGLGAAVAHAVLPVSFQWMAEQVAKLCAKPGSHKQAQQQPSRLEVGLPLQAVSPEQQQLPPHCTLRARLTLDTQQVDMHDLMKSRPAATAAVSHSLSHSPSRLPLGAESTHLQPGGNGRRALKLRDCNAWSPVAYADMQASGAAESTAGKVTDGTPGGAGVVPVVLASPPPQVMRSKGSSANSRGGSSSVVVLESSVASDGTRQEVLRSLCQVINTTEFVLEVSLVSGRVAEQRTMAQIAAAAPGGRELVGCVEPGGRLALPHCWRAEGKELQVRPSSQQPQSSDSQASLSSATDASHLGWSGVPGRAGAQSDNRGLALAELEDGSVCLMCCPGVSSSGVTPNGSKGAAQGPLGAGATGAPTDFGPEGGALMAAAAQADNQSHWLSVTVDSDPLVVAQEGVNVTFDWRISVQPPLLVHNTLPVGAKYVVWERSVPGGMASSGGQGVLQACAWGWLEAWGTAHVYAADMRQQVYLSFWPDGCTFAEMEPVLISNGLRRKGAAPVRLLDSFRCTYTHSTSSPPGMPLRMYLTRTLECTPESSNGEAEASSSEGSVRGGAGSGSPSPTALAEAVAHGCPMSVRLWVPLWLVNGTQLPISAGVVAVQQQQQQQVQDYEAEKRLLEGGFGAPPAVAGALDAPPGMLMSESQLRVIDTGRTSAPYVRPPCSITLMPRSLELMSHSLLPPAATPQSAGQQQFQQQAGTQIPGVCLSVMGSRWSAPLMLPSVEQDRPVPDAAAGSNGGSLSESALLRARSSDGTTVHELVAHVGPASSRSPLGSASTAAGEGTGKAAGLDGVGGLGLVSVNAAGQGQQPLVLRLEPALVAVNRTGFDLSLLQPEAVVPGKAAGLGGPLGAGVGSIQAASQQHADCASRIEAALDRAGGSLPLPPAVMTVPAGAVGVPLHWHTACEQKLLCLALPPQAEGGPPLLSEPFSYSALSPGEVMHVLLPLCRVSAPSPPSHAPSPTAADTQGGCEDSQLWAAAYPVAHQLLRAACRGGGTQPSSQVPQQQQSSDARPFLMRAARLGAQAASRQQSSGMGAAGEHCVCVVVSMRLVPRGTLPGCYALVLSSLGDAPPHLLHNATHATVAYHEASVRMPWQLLPPLSAHGFVCQDMLGSSNASRAPSHQQQQPVLVEVCSPGDPDCLAFNLSGEASAAGTLSNASPSGSAALRPAGSIAGAGGTNLSTADPRGTSLVAQMADAAELVMGKGGVVYVQGSNSTQSSNIGGAPRSERLLRLVPGMASTGAAHLVPGAQPRSGRGYRASTWMLLPSTRVLTPDLAQGGVAASVHVTLEVTGLEVSLVDHRPQELLVLSLDGLVLEWAAGSSGGLAYSQFGARLRDLQVDDQLPESPHPVILRPSNDARKEGFSKDSLIAVQLVSESGRHRGCVYYPSIAVRVLPMNLAIGEALMWRLVTAARILASALPGSAAPAPTAQGGGAVSGAAAQATSEVPLQIDIMNVTDVDMKLSFKADAVSRPRVTNQSLSLALDLASLRELPLSLPGVELEGVRVQGSALQQMMAARLQQRLFGIAMSVLRSSGLFGSASKLFAAASHGVGALTDSSSQAPGARRAEVAHLGEGFFEGGRAFGANMLRGATGIITKPMEGAGKGIGGFFGGVAKGLVGAAASPIGGALAAASKVTEGMDAQYRMLYGTRQSNRKRLPRPFTGDRMLRPFSLHPALGQALMHGATLPDSAAAAMTKGLSRQLLSRMVGVGSSSAATPTRSGAVFIGDAYEDHFLLPGDKVLLITTRRLIYLDAPGFVALQQRVMSGEAVHVTDAPGGTIVWSLQYKSMLTAELAWHQQLRGVPPDGVLVHRKKHSQQDNALVYDVRCRPNTHQAQEILQAINTTRRRYDTRPGQVAAELKSKQMLPAVSDAGQQLPETVICMDFKLVWVAVRRAASGAQITSSVWRPVGPPGYAIFGDVAVSGTERPSHPIRMYRDTFTPHPDYALGGDPATVAGEAESGPRLAPPVGYALVFRDGASPPVTLWRPIPPRGYTEIGHVAWPEIEEPPLSLVRCLRSDLVKNAAVFEAPLWFGESTDNRFWVASIWKVDSPLCTFVATKNNRPPARCMVPSF